jgi:tetratricopeptide (TPR) repeat protein
MLRSKRVIPAGTGLRCPGCRTSFTATASLVSTQPVAVTQPVAAPSSESSPLKSPAFLIAAAAALLLGVASLAVVLVAVLRSPDKAPTPGGEQAALAANDASHETDKDKDKTKDDGKDDELEKKRKALAAEKEKLEQEKAKFKHDALVGKAELAMAKKDYAQAVKLYREALQLFPSEKTTALALASAMSAELEAKKSGDDAEKRKQEVDRLLADARDWMKQKKYDAAVRDLESARALDVSNKEVRAALDEAREALDKDKSEQKRKTDYEAHLARARAAMKAEDFVTASTEAQAALKLMPEDVEADKLLKAADARIANLGDLKKRQAAFDRLVDQARKAQQATRYNDATQAITAALRLFPDDREAKRLANDVRLALARAKTDNAKLLAQGDSQAKLGNLNEARNLYAKAVQNWAEDAAADKALRQVEGLLGGGGGGGGFNEGVFAMYVAWTRAVRLGQAAMLDGRYADAVVAYGTAVELLPSDLNSGRELERARRLLKRQLERKVEYDRQMQLAGQAMDRSAFGSAIKYYLEALRLFPDDPTAALNLSKARYNKAMSDGNRMYSTLVRQPSADLKEQTIQAFQAALNEKPNDQLAKTKLVLAQGVRVPRTQPPPKDRPIKDLMKKDTTTKDKSK